ncbi:MAG: oligosaccharide flippase family protein [Bacilli bacterium]|nr:oligosaccharide flippase family protein [Bacilli bacterium]
MSESRIKNIQKNITYTFIFQFIKLILVFLNRVIFVACLGPVYLGINSLFTNILSFLTLADFGVITAMMYSLFKPLANKDEKKISEYVFFFNKIYNVIALAIFILGIIIMPFLKYFVNLPVDVDNIYIYYFLMLINVVIGYLFVYKTTILLSDQKKYIINSYDTKFYILLFIIQVLILYLTKNFILYLIANIITTLLSNIFKARKVNKLYPYLDKYKEKTLDKKEKKEVFKNVKDLFLYRIGAVIQNNTDNILISIFVGTIIVGYYSTYLMIISGITSFVNLIFSSIKSSLGNYIVKEKKEDQLKMFFILEDINFLIIGFCASCFIILIPDFIEMFFGKEYLLSNITLILVVGIFYTENIRQNIWMFRETTGIFGKTKYANLVTAVLNLILSIILGYYFKIDGILFASIISCLLFAWWMEPKIMFKEYFNSSSKKYFFNYIKNVLIIVIIIIINSYLININLSNIYINFIIKLILTVIITSILLIIPFIKSNTFNYIKSIILEHLNKNKKSN